MAQIPCHPKKAFRKADAPTRLSGVITRWEDGASFGFITGGDGESYFLSGSDLPTRYSSPARGHCRHLRRTRRP